jgi:hypothetical protein
MANLHPASVDAALERWGASSLRDQVVASSQLDTAHHYVEAVGLYTNGVHQAINYPLMRETLLMSVFRLLLESKSPEQWARKYSRNVLSALREADYTLIKWTQ